MPVARSATVALSPAGGSPPAGYFASPTGSATGAGTYADPWTLKVALAGGYPANTVQPGDTVWLRGGTYVPTPTTANMQGTTITKVVALYDVKTITSSTNPWVAGDVGKNITVYGAGANGGDLVTHIDSFVDAGRVTLHDKVLRGTMFETHLAGTVNAPITFRGYPGERATIDNNFDPDVLGNAEPGIKLNLGGNDIGAPGKYQILRDIEITNTQSDCMLPADYSLVERGDCVIMLSPGSKLINCFLHDGGEGVFPAMSGLDLEIYGNLFYFNGEYAPTCEQIVGASVDLPDASGTQVTVGNQTNARGQSVLTFSHNNNGDYTLVVVGGLGSNKTKSDYSATFDGAAMTFLNGVTPGDYPPYTGMTPLAVFGIAGHAGTHNVVITATDSAPYLAAMACSFSNVHQSQTPAAGGVFAMNRFDDPETDAQATTSSATNHLVVDGLYIHGSYTEGDIKDYLPRSDGDNYGHILPGPFTGNNPGARMSWATGKASVLMAWRWTPLVYPHGHGMYLQAGYTSDTIATVAGSDIVHSSVAEAMFRSSHVGCTIRIIDAGAAGADYVGTITEYFNYGQVRVSSTVPTSTGILTITDGAMTNGSKILTSASGQFLSTHVGKVINVAGAGAGGTLLWSRVATFNSTTSVTLDDANASGGDISGKTATIFQGEASWSKPRLIKHNLWYEAASLNIQAYGSSGACAVQTHLRENLHVHRVVDMGGLSGYRMTDSRLDKCYLWSANLSLGYHMAHFRNFEVTDNVVHSVTGLIDPSTWDDLVVTGNTFIGPTNGFDSGDFPENTYYANPPAPTTNLVVVLPNAYEANRANIIIYNWENLTNVSVDLSSAVAAGTAIRIVNAQDYFSANGVVYEGTYSGGTVSLPMTGLTQAYAVASDINNRAREGPTGPAFNAFIVRAQSEETWR